MLDQLSSAPDQPVPAACGDWAATKAAYRFFDNPRVTEHGVLAGHLAATAARRAASEGPILIAGQDRPHPTLPTARGVITLTAHRRIGHTLQPTRLDRYWQELQSERGLESPMKDIQTLRTQYRVSDFVSWQRDDALELNPNFQRRPVWKSGAKSYLIDTILRGLPMPIIFLRDLRSDLRTFKSKRDVVDGQQRIRTILSYINPELLRDYNPQRDDFTISRVHNKEYAGKKFSELGERVKQRILDYQFSVHSFAADTDDREILQIFARMNSTGVKLNAQELRNAEFFGEFKQMCYELATEQLNRWREWGIFTPDQIARMGEVELTSELVMLALNGITGKSKTQIDKYYEAYDKGFPSVNEVSTRIRDTLDFIHEALNWAEIDQYFSSLSLFYAMYTTIYGLRYGLRSPTARGLPPALDRERPKGVERGAVQHILDRGRAIAHGIEVPLPVSRALRGATADAGSRRLIIGYLAGEGNDPCPPQN